MCLPKSHKLDQVIFCSRFGFQLSGEKRQTFATDLYLGDNNNSLYFLYKNNKKIKYLLKYNNKLGSVQGRVGFKNCIVCYMALGMALGEAKVIFFLTIIGKQLSGTGSKMVKYSV